MAERVVVSFRARGSAEPGPDDAARLEQVRAVLKRAQAVGGTICSWGTQAFSLAFASEDLEEVIELLTGDGLRPALAQFCVGVSEGPVTPLQAATGSIELAVGAPIARALALAGAGGPGELLLDTHMAAVRRGELHTSGARLAKAGGKRVRGCRLDLAQPWGLPPDRALQGFSEPARMVGRTEVLKKLQTEPGALVVLRAEPGVGGSRLLREHMKACEGRALLLQPAGLGREPLGSLRRALQRERARGGTVQLPPEQTAVLEALERGEGAEVSAAAELLEEWLSPSEATLPGLVLLDDVNDVDAATLEVVGASMLGATRPFRCVARLDGVTQLPSQLASLPSGAEVKLGPLSKGEAEQVAQGWLGGAAGSWVAEWAERGAGVPLAIGEAIAVSLSTGELLWSRAGVQVRGKAAAQSQPMLAREWIAARWGLLDTQCRALLQAVAVLGGESSAEQALELLRAASDAPAEVIGAAQVLVGRGWLQRPREGWLALVSRTHLQAVLEAIPDRRRAAWHRAASLLIEAREGPLAAAEAGRQASLAKDRKRAARLFHCASKAAASAQLDSAAAELAAIARAEEPAGDERADSTRGAEPARISLHAPASNLAAALLASARIVRNSYPPVEIPLPVERARAARPAAQPARKPEIPPAPALPKVPRPPAAPSVDELAAVLPSPAREALSSRDLEALEVWAEREPKTEQRERLVHRVRAIVIIGQGDKGEALRVLREGCEHAEGLSLLEQSRSHLALAVGLAQSGRALESLVEAIDALSRARAAADPMAEKACLAFVQRVYVAAGHGEQSSAWVPAVGA